MASRTQIASSSSSSSSLPSKLETNNNVCPWLQLPDYLTEKILERLPIADYVRFGAVCSQWLTVQEHHRRRHAPSSPPMLILPWFIPREPQQEPVVISIPFPATEQQSPRRMRIPLSRRYLEQGIESQGRSWRFSSPSGWLVLDDKSLYGRYYFTLLNPISALQIELPGEGIGLYMGCKLAASPPPGCVAFLVAYDKWGKHVRLFREGDDCWTELQFPDQHMPWDRVSVDETCAIVWRGKVYYMYLSMGIMVVDPLPTDPTIEFLEMDQCQLPALSPGWVDNVFHRMELFMLESDGKVLLVVEFFESDETFSDAREAVVGFQVFEADFSNKRWARMESLGDRVLFIHQNFVCSLLAADIGVEGNCIYCLDPSKLKEIYQENSYLVEPIPWSVFNLGTGMLIESSLPYPPTPHTHRMFVPSLC